MDYWTVKWKTWKLVLHVASFTGLDQHIFYHKIVNIFLPNRLIERLLLLWSVDDFWKFDVNHGFQVSMPGRFIHKLGKLKKKKLRQKQLIWKWFGTSVFGITLYQ